MLNHVKDEQNRFLLVYGSATGQAKAIAEEIAEKAPSFGLSAELHSLEETGKRFDIENEKCLVIIISTTGDGDPPANAEKFMRRIKKRTLDKTYLAHLHYALLGLGDSNYSNFCRCARDLDSRLEELGAQRFYPTGLADDGVGLEVVADPWLDGLYLALQRFLGVAQTSEMVLTEKVLALKLSESNGCDDSKDFKHAVECDEIITKSVINADVSLTKTAEDVQELSVSSSSTDSGITNGTKDSLAYDKKVNELIVNDVAGLEFSSDVLPPTETKPVTSLQKDISVININSSHIPNGIAGETCIAYTNKQTEYMAISGCANQKFPETKCVPVPLSDSLGSALALTHSLPPLSEQTLTIPVLPPAYLAVTFGADRVEIDHLPYQNGCKLPCAASDVFRVPVLTARVLTAPDAVKKTLNLKLNKERLDVKYSPGDSISVICPNNSSEVALLLDRLGLLQRANSTVTISVIPNTTKRRAAIPPHIHPVSSLLHIFTTCVNIREPPNKAFIRALIEHTADKLHVRRMQELCCKEGVQVYTQVIRETNISLLDFLYAFPSCNPPVETVLEHLTRLQPRPYSICSCPETSPTTLDLVFNVVEIPANREQGHLYHRRGVCTGWLDDITLSLQSGKSEDVVEIPVFLRTNQHFRPPDDISKPLIMIGPGTGVAPFIGFLQQRATKKQQLHNVHSYGETWLFYGCRNKDKDFLFREELQNFESEGTLTKLCVAFSRDQPAETSDVASASQPPRYVQDFLHLVAHDVARLLVELEALVYVCGDARNMAKDVNEALERILQTEKGLSLDDAHLFMMKKRIHKTYFEDVWV